MYAKLIIVEIKIYFISFFRNLFRPSSCIVSQLLFNHGRQLVAAYPNGDQTNKCSSVCGRASDEQTLEPSLKKFCKQAFGWKISIQFVNGRN